MKTKVTLSLDDDFVREAKQFAKSKNKSLSSLVTESVKKNLKNQKEVKEKLAIISKLAGSIKLPPENAKKSYDQLRSEAMSKKYDLS